MRLPHFVDEDVIEYLEKHKSESSNEDDPFEEHAFLTDCLSLGLTIQDLKELTFNDVMKIMICKIRENRKEAIIPKATQSDWDALAGG